MKWPLETHRDPASLAERCSSIVSVIRIESGEKGGDRFTVDAHEETPADDRIWRPEFAGEDVWAESHDGIDRHATRPMHSLELGAAALPQRLHWRQPDAEIELTSQPTVEAIGGTVHTRPATSTLQRLPRQPATAAARRRRILQSILTAVAVGSVGVVIGRSSIRPTSEAVPRAATLAEMSTQRTHFDSVTSSRRLTLPTSTVPAQPCRHFIAAAADAVDTDAAWWIVSVINSGAHLGQTLDEAIRDRLVTARTVLLRSEPSDAERTHELALLDSVISLAAEQPCSSTGCSYDEPGAIEHGSTAESTVHTHASSHWLCPP